MSYWIKKQSRTTTNFYQNDQIFYKKIDGKILKVKQFTKVVLHISDNTALNAADHNLTK